MLAQRLALRWTERRLRVPFEAYPRHEGLAGFLLYALAGWALAWGLHKFSKRREKR